MQLRTLKSMRPKRTTKTYQGIGAAYYTWDEIARCNFPSSIPVGVIEDGVYCYPFRQHCLVSGQTDAGKTMSVLLNTLLLTAYSSDQPHVVCIDSKATTFRNTSEIFIRRGYKVLHIDMRGHSEDSYNPLQGFINAYAESNYDLAEEELARVLDSLKQQVASSKDRFWENAASDLIRALTYYCVETQKGQVTLNGIAELVSRRPGVLRDLGENLLLKDNDSQAARYLAMALHTINTKETFACVQASAQTMLSFYASVTGKRVAANSTFSFQELLESPEPIALFITAADESSGGSKEYSALLFDQLYREYSHLFEIENLEETSSTRGVKVIIDEFASFPTCEIPTVVATSRSRNFFVMAAVQSTEQMVAQGYSRPQAQVILSQFGSALFMRSNDEALAEVASNRTAGLVGQDELLHLNQGEAFALMPGGRPAMRVSLPFFNHLIEEKCFSVVAMTPEEASTNEETAQASSDAISMRLLLAQRMKFAKQFRTRVSRTKSFDSFVSLLNELSELPELPDDDAVSKCASALKARIDCIFPEASKKLPFIDPICSKQMSVNPALDELYLSFAEAIFLSDENIVETSGIMTSFCLSLLRCVEDFIKDLEQPVEPNQVLPMISLGKVVSTVVGWYERAAIEESNLGSTVSLVKNALANSAPQTRELLESFMEEARKTDFNIIDGLTERRQDEDVLKFVAMGVVLKDMGPAVGFNAYPAYRANLFNQ